MRTLRRFHALYVFVVLASVLATILGVVIWVKAAHLENTAAPAQLVDSPYRPVPMEGTERPSALFAGDDFTAGYGLIGINAYPYIVCYSIGLNCNVDAQTGTGLVNDGRDQRSGNLRLIDRLPTDRKIYDVDLVIVDAGRNDLGESLNIYGEALEQYLTEIKRFWPTAKIVVIAPSFLSVEPDPGYGERISLISRIVESFNGVLIDPLAEGWYEGVDVSDMELPDGVHPNQYGQSFIAKKLGESLQSHGIGQSGATN